MIFVFLLAKTFAWQLVDELCRSQAFDQAVLPLNWCSKTVNRCQWQNITCDANNELLSLELFNVPLNIPVPDKIDAPGPSIRTLKMVNCGLRGPMPRTFDAVTTLRIVDFSNNALEGEWPWVMSSRLEQLNIANNKLGGLTYFNSLDHPGQWQATTHFNIANNSFTENWVAVSEVTWPALRYFNIENNQFSGQAPSMKRAYQFRIGGNYFSYFESNALPPPSPSDPLILSDCDMTGVPFRPLPPDWLKPRVSACRYEYDPSNKVYNNYDFTSYRSTPSTTPTPIGTTLRTVFPIRPTRSTMPPVPTSFSVGTFPLGEMTTSLVVNGAKRAQKTAAALALICLAFYLY